MTGMDPDEVWRLLRNWAIDRAAAEGYTLPPNPWRHMVGRTLPTGEYEIEVRDARDRPLVIYRFKP